MVLAKCCGGRTRFAGFALRFAGFGRLLYALGFIVMAATGLGAHDFVLSQQPIPKDIPRREMLAFLSGAILLLGGFGLLIGGTAKVSALVLTRFFFL